MAIARPRGRLSQRVKEMKQFLRQHFADAKFLVTRMPDARKGIAIWTYTNADWDEVQDLVADREFEIMMDDELFIYVVPMPLDAYNGKHV